MKYFWLITLWLLFNNTGAYAQVKEAIIDQADTMRKYISDNKPGDEVVIRKIVFEGNDVTRRSVLLREMSVHEGQTVVVDSLPTLLNQNKLRLVNLSLFNNITLSVVSISHAEVELHIHLEERWFIIPSGTIQFADRNFNTWWVEENHDLRRAILGLTLTDKNFRGNLETLAATVQVGYSQKLALTYTRPYIDKDQKQGLGFMLSIAKSEQTYYKTDSDKLEYVGNYTGPAILTQFEAGVSYIYRPQYATRHIVQLSYKDYSVSDTLLKLNTDYFSGHSTHAKLLELQYRFEYNNVDNWNYPVLGFKFVGYGVVRAGFEGLKFQSYINVEAGLFRNPFPKWYFSTVFRGRFMLPQEEPYYFQGGLGTQTDYVRGYEYNVIDGSHYGVLRFDLKRQILNKLYSDIPVRYFTAFPLRIYPKIFTDIGYINSDQPGNSTLSNRLLYSAGVGVDIVTLYDIKIRIEFAWNHLGRNGLYLHFNSE